ncbi:G-protein coupled receptor GRL101 [Biomphalaria glabrata]|nr:G-protein coupled receptor GRL101 [Biomphalaria glabrata]
MDTFFWFAAMCLLCSLVGHSSPWVPDLCNRAELDLVIKIDCQYPPLKWDMITNILKILNPAYLVNMTRNWTVTLIDVIGQNYMIVDDTNIADVSHICQKNTEDNRIDTGGDKIFKLKSNKLGEKFYSSKTFIISIYQKKSGVDYNFSSIFSKQQDLTIYISDANDFDAQRDVKFNDTIKVNSQDDLRFNNLLSSRLCNRCLDGWFPLSHMNIIISCFLFEKQRKGKNWPDAANYCVRKRSLLTIFETESFLLEMWTRLLNFSNPFSKKNPSKKYISLWLGMFILNNVQLTWTDNRPVDPNTVKQDKQFFESIGDTKKFCFGLELTKDLINITFFVDNCRTKRTKYTLCEQKIVYFYELWTYLSRSLIQMEGYWPPDFNKNFISSRTTIHFIWDSNKSMRSFRIVSISNTRSLLSIDFPTFQCKDINSRISYNYVCDGVLDCSNGEDEQVCNYEFQDLQECLKRQQSLCHDPNVNGLKCIAKRQVCNMIEDCPDGSDETNCDDCIFSQCLPNVCIPDHLNFNCYDVTHYIDPMVKYGIRYPHSFDEPKSMAILNFITVCNKTVVNLKDSGKYNRVWAPKCIYIKDRHGSNIGCDNFHHLSNCKSFSCPDGFMKCFESYCIPDVYKNDGVEDCPKGEDEGLRYNIDLYFECMNTLRKIDPIYICDGKPQCPRADDELNCKDWCPSGFFCLDGTVTFNGTNILRNATFFSPNTTFLNISGFDVSQNNNFINMLSLKKLLVFIGSRCHINDKTRVLSENSLVYHLDISFNNLVELTYNDFYSQFSNLYILNISHNIGLSVIPRFYFRQFRKLILLDLSFTKITEIILHYNLNLQFLHLSYTNITEISLIDNHKIKFLNLSVTNIKNVVLSRKADYEIIDLRETRTSDFINEHFFNNITVKGKVLADYKLCCSYFRGENLPAHQCEAEEQPLSTCEDLIGDSFKGALLWIVAIIAFFGNMITLGYRILFERATLHQTYVLFVTCLGVSDLLMGVYLVIIASVDVVYRGVYIVHEMSWKQSTLCQIAGTLATLSSETSTFFILFITLERFLTIRFPFGEHKISRFAKYVIISTGWFVGFILSLIPIMYKNMAVYSTSEMCLGFPLRKSNGVAWTYSMTIFLFLNSFLFVVIAFGQLLIFISISQQNSKFTTSSQSLIRRAENVAVAFRLSLVVLSNFICWFPVCVMGIRTVVSDYEVSRDTYAWVVTLVLPVNSALNPILYTVPRLIKSWRDFKRKGSTQFSSS